LHFQFDRVRPDLGGLSVALTHLAGVERAMCTSCPGRVDIQASLGFLRTRSFSLGFCGHESRWSRRSAADGLLNLVPANGRAETPFCPSASWWRSLSPAAHYPSISSGRRRP
jgi:hypothetical protein